MSILICVRVDAAPLVARDDSPQARCSSSRLYAVAALELASGRLCALPDRPRLFGGEEDLIHKATGWLLREAGKGDMKRLEMCLLAKGPKIPRTTVRYAIERFPTADRKRLLAATKKKR